MTNVYEQCPNCKKKGLHERHGNNAILDNCIMSLSQWSCKYCDYDESDKENRKRADEK